MVQDGGHLTGTIPRWIADCLPHLKELDLSFNWLSGPLPDWLPVMGGHLQQLKVQQNQVLWLHAARDACSISRA
jgi:hypothetical protein